MRKKRLECVAVSEESFRYNGNFLNENKRERLIAIYIHVISIMKDKEIIQSFLESVLLLFLLNSLLASIRVRESKRERRSSAQAFSPSLVLRREGGEEETRERRGKEREREMAEERESDRERERERGRAIWRERKREIAEEIRNISRRGDR